MSITLKIAAAVSVVCTRAREITNGFGFQKLGTSFRDATKLSVTQKTGKTNTATSRWAVARPYTYVDADGKTKTEYYYVSVETTIPDTCPLTTVEEIPHLVQSIGAEPQFLTHTRDRIQPS